MAAYYTVVQYVPDPVADERINVGVVGFARGRVLVRPSGTEPVVRVMVEAPTAEEAQATADALAAATRAAAG